jgi:tRNA pseudouridine55 synthase
MITFETLEMAQEEESLDRFLMPISSTVQTWPEVRLTDSTAYYLRQGQPVIVAHAPTSGWVRLAEILDETSTRFIGVGEILEDGRVAPRRLVVK